MTPSAVKWELTAFSGTDAQRKEFLRLIKAAPAYYKAVEYWLDQIYDGESLHDWQVDLVNAHRQAKGELSL